MTERFFSTKQSIQSFFDFLEKIFLFINFRQSSLSALRPPIFGALFETKKGPERSALKFLERAMKNGHLQEKWPRQRKKEKLRHFTSQVKVPGHCDARSMLTGIFFQILVSQSDIGRETAFYFLISFLEKTVTTLNKGLLKLRYG